MKNLMNPATRVLTFCAFAALSMCPVQAQIQHSGQPLHWGDNDQVLVNWKTFAPLDLAALEAEDAVTATMKDAPWRFGIEHQVEWNMQNAGVWTEEDGMRIWRLAVRAEGTLSWSFYLSRFVVPKGGELYVWNEDRSAYLGAFNHLNVKEWEGLALSLIEGAGAVIEYREPLGLDVGGEIAVGQVKTRRTAPSATAGLATSTSIVQKVTIGKSKTNRWP